MKNARPFILLLALLIPANLLADNRSLQISQARIQAGPPMAQVLAAYMTIKNTSDKTIVINNATSPLFRSIEFHRTFYEGGMMRMRKQTQLVIAAHATLQLKPGGYHMMLIKPNKRLKPGDRVPVTFLGASKKLLTITLTVKLPDTSLLENKLSTLTSGYHKHE